MGGWVDGWMGGWVDGWMGGWGDGEVGRWGGGEVGSGGVGEWGRWWILDFGFFPFRSSFFVLQMRRGGPVCPSWRGNGGGGFGFGIEIVGCISGQGSGYWRSTWGRNAPARKVGNGGGGEF
ncbi:hypothetical protein E1H13_09435 [Nodosilinea sp. P-1105]|nr:hypothetical protein [Nodosilinea sp. P-1105]